MTAPKGSKDAIVVNCQEVPETICVETKFISQCGKLKNIEKIYFPTAIGNFDFNKDNLPLFGKNGQAVSKTPNTVTVNPRQPTKANFQQCQLPQQLQPVATSFGPPINNAAFLAGQDLLRPAVGNQLKNSSQVSPFMLNPPVLPVTLVSPNISHCVSKQMQQTGISALNKNSIGIQCNMDDELDVEWTEENENCCETQENVENDKENFLQFVKDNSSQHKNCKECLVCGELCKSNKYFYGHMAVHRGPEVLCCKCGQLLEHKNLLSQHRCQKAKLLTKSFLKCPHFSCNVNAISLLELYDHINEHTNTQIYKCSACKKGFCTSQEFLRHILIRAKCFTSARRKRFRIYGLETQKDLKCRVRVFTLHTYKKCTTLVKTFLTQRDNKKGVCKVCFKSFSNQSVYNRHRQLCIAKFKKRLMRKNRNIH